MEHRSKIWNRYREGLEQWAADKGIRLPIIPSHCQQSFHMFYLLMPDLKTRHAFIEYMKTEEILCVFHYIPLHLSDMGARFGAKAGDCPVSQDVSDRLVRLPFYNKLEVDQQELIIDKIKRFGLET